MIFFFKKASYWKLSITKSEKNKNKIQIYIFGFLMGSHEYRMLIKDLSFTSNLYPNLVKFS